MLGRPAAGGGFITFEGTEGAGKSTQVARLAAALRSAGIDTFETREPGGTEIGEEIRAALLHRGRDAAISPWTDALLFNAARAALVLEVIRPALDAGQVVLCDRFADSTVAYQGYGAGLPVADLRTVERLATGGLEPDLTILLDLPADIGLGRKAGAETRFEQDYDLAFHRRVRDGFLAIARTHAERFAIVDATLPPDTAAARIVEAVRRHAALVMVPGITGIGEPNAGVRRITG